MTKFTLKASVPGERTITDNDFQDKFLRQLPCFLESSQDYDLTQVDLTQDQMQQAHEVLKSRKEELEASLKDTIVGCLQDNDIQAAQSNQSPWQNPAQKLDKMNKLLTAIGIKNAFNPVYNFYIAILTARFDYVNAPAPSSSCSSSLFSKHGPTGIKNASDFVKKFNGEETISEIIVHLNERFQNGPGDWHPGSFKTKLFESCAKLVPPIQLLASNFSEKSKKTAKVLTAILAQNYAPTPVQASSANLRQ